MNITKCVLNNELSFFEVLKAAPNFICNLFTFLYGKKGFYGPTFLTWVLTDECQSKCKHCYRDSIPSFLSGDERLSITENIARSSVYWVSLTGGEPLIIPEVIDIARILKNHNKKVTITTNGYLLNKFVREIINIKLDAVHISVDSHRGKVHDYLRNTPGLFDKIHNTILEIRKHRSFKRPAVKLRCTISKINYLEMIDYVKFWKEKVDAIHFQPIVNNSINRVRDKNLMFTQEDEVLFRNILSRLQREYTFFRNMYYSLMPDYIFNRRELHERLSYKCLLVSSSGLYILPDGNVVSCYGRREEILGNVKNDSISDIWKSKKTINLQRKIRDTSSECFCWEPHTLFNLYHNSLDKLVRRTIGKR